MKHCPAFFDSKSHRTRSIWQWVHKTTWNVRTLLSKHSGSVYPSTKKSKKFTVVPEGYTRCIGPSDVTEAQERLDQGGLWHSAPSTRRSSPSPAVERPGSPSAPVMSKSSTLFGKADMLDSRSSCKRNNDSPFLCDQGWKTRKGNIRLDSEEKSKSIISKHQKIWGTRWEALCDFFKFTKPCDFGNGESKISVGMLPWVTTNEQKNKTN